jgi:hypothetical protein
LLIHIIMAWRSSGISNAELIANLARNGVFHSDRVANVSGYFTITRQSYSHVIN